MCYFAKAAYVEGILNVHFLDHIAEPQILSKSYRGLFIPWETSHD